jgi:hypothetical protein
MLDPTEALGLAKAVGRLTIALATIEAERDQLKAQLEKKDED